MELRGVFTKDDSYWSEIYEQMIQEYALTNKLNVPSLDTYCPPSQTISGINPTILNLKSDLDSLYKPKRLFKLDISQSEPLSIETLEKGHELSKTR